eukprot:CAMPEP_0180639704 /NCGR_PEP_ID=MMETSP1037_2-20121125/45204_1 /TAXON_ID=632150 /ORGANISM="Azadinium spinosum, Strain 3D9" /LENGTH=69 /DNA_ID=CAMNT_0022661725 /DNA_START=183 /DNA_END=392 /DNA_ORIENTATION=-
MACATETASWRRCTSAIDLQEVAKEARSRGTILTLRLRQTLNEAGQIADGAALAAEEPASPLGNHLPLR